MSPGPSACRLAASCSLTMSWKTSRARAPADCRPFTSGRMPTWPLHSPSWLADGLWSPPGNPSHPEQPAVARLDLLAHPLDRDRVVLHGLDVRQRSAPWPFPGVRVHGAQAADIDDQLLRLRR